MLPIHPWSYHSISRASPGGYQPRLCPAVSCCWPRAGRLCLSLLGDGSFLPTLPRLQMIQTSTITGECQHPEGTCPPPSHRLGRAGWFLMPPASRTAQGFTGAVTIYPPFPDIPLKLLLLPDRWTSWHPVAKSSFSTQAKFPSGKDDISRESWTYEDLNSAMEKALFDSHGINYSWKKASLYTKFSHGCLYFLQSLVNIYLSFIIVAVDCY